MPADVTRRLDLAALGWAALLGVGGFLLVLYVTAPFGMGLTADSVGYISAARGLTSGRGLVMFDGLPMTDWPPLFPVLLSALEVVFRIDPLGSARIVNAVVFGLIVSKSAFLFSTHLRRFRALALAGSAAVLASVSLLSSSAHAWSEPLFILLTILFLLGVEQYSRDFSRRWMVVLAVLAALAGLTRFIGLALAPVGVLVILLVGTIPPGVRVTRAAAFAALAVTPLGAWLLRQVVVNGSMFGPRGSSRFDVSQSAEAATTVLATWLAPPEIRPQIPIIVVLVAVVIAAAMRGHGERLAVSRLAAGGMLPAAAFIVSYLVLLLSSSATVAFDRINERLMAPILVPALLILLYLFQAAQRPPGGLLPRGLGSWLLLAGLLVWLTYPIGETVRYVERVRVSGVGGLGAAAWQQSETVRYLRETGFSDGLPLYTNAPDATYILASVESRYSPHKTFYNSPDVWSSPDELRGAWPPEGVARLVWFGRTTRAYLYTPQELGELAEVRQAMSFSDGAVYIVTRKPAN